MNIPVGIGAWQVRHVVSLNGAHGNTESQFQGIMQSVIHPCFSIWGIQTLRFL